MHEQDDPWLTGIMEEEQSETQKKGVACVGPRKIKRDPGKCCQGIGCPKAALPNWSGVRLTSTLTLTLVASVAAKVFTRLHNRCPCLKENKHLNVTLSPGFRDEVTTSASLVSNMLAKHSQSPQARPCFIFPRGAFCAELSDWFPKYTDLRS